MNLKRVLTIALMALIVPSASYAFSSASSKANVNFVNSSNTNTPGITTSAAMIAPPHGEARAKTGIDPLTGKATAGVQALGTGAYSYVSAYASWQDSWSSGALVCGGVVPCAQLATTLHLDGFIDPVMVDPFFLPEDGYSWAEFILKYSLVGSGGVNTDYSVNIYGWYDGYGSGELTAGLNTNNNGVYAYTDLTPFLIFGAPNANGDIPITFDYIVSPPAFMNGFTETFSMMANVDNYGGVTGSLNIDFFNTFTVNHASPNQNSIIWVSEGGAGGAPPVVPEPATLMLLGGGLAGLAIWGRYRARRS